MALRSDDDLKNGKPHSKRTLDSQNLDQIEYLLYQSTQGYHLAFNHDDIVKIFKNSKNNEEFINLENMTKVQELLSRFVEKTSLFEKQCFLETLDSETYELLVRAYFQLVENTILAHSSLRH